MGEVASGVGSIVNSGLRVVDNVLGTQMSGGNATSDAIDAQTRAANQANETSKYIYDTQRQDLAPWRESGVRALSGLENENLLNNFQGDPGYQFRLQEGMKAINASGAARGMANSGATLKALTRYGQDYASNEYNNAYNRQFNRLSTLAGYGNNANQAGVSASGAYGQQVAGNQIGLGNSIASANIAQANNQSQLIGQGAQAAATYFSDERLKINVKPISKADLDEMKKHLKPYLYKYTNENYGKGEWVGVMAQDLEKSRLGKLLIIEDENGYKQIDMKKVMSLFLATLAEG